MVKALNSRPWTLKIKPQTLRPTIPSPHTNMETIQTRLYLNPKSRQNNSPKPINIAQKASILHTFGVQVGFRVQGFRKNSGPYQALPEGGSW